MKMKKLIVSSLACLLTLPMMAQLGEAIGKYVNINATVPVYVGNRQIAREIKKISADNDFATNS
jgi:hypothetical protein